MRIFIQQAINGISVGGVYALIATGYALIYSLLGFSNWAHGEVAMLGAYMAIVFSASLNLPLPLAFIIGILFSGFVSLFNEKIAYKRIRDKNSPTMFLMIAAMGLSTTYQNTVMNIFGAKFRVFQGVSSNSVQIGNITIGLLDLITLIVAFISLFFLDYMINRTKLGLGIRCVASNSTTASLMGINTAKYYAIVFIIAGFFAGISGILLGMKYTVYPTMGNVAYKAFIASVLGGLGSVRGAILGALIIGVSETFVSAYLSSGLRDLFTYTILIVILLVKPSGLMGVSVEDKA